MTVSCSICGDVFVLVNPDESIYTTVCGHLFHYDCLIKWFERSKSCPQCRQKTNETKIIRIFFNHSNTNVAEEDPSFLKFRVEGLEFQLEMKEKHIKTLSEERLKTAEQNKKLRKEIKDNAQKVILSEEKLYTVTDELKSLKSYCKQLSEYKLETEELKRKLAACKSVDKIINGSVNDAIVTVDSTELDAEYLEKCVKYFKQKIKKLETEYKCAEKDILSYRKKIAFQNKLMSELRTKYNHLKQSSGQEKTGDDSLIKISDDSSNNIGNTSFDIGVNVQKSFSSLKTGNNSRSINLDDSASSSVSLSKPNPIFKLKSSSLIGVTQNKFRIPKLVSSGRSDGDESYVSTKYENAGKIAKKSKKVLSSSVVLDIKTMLTKT